MGQFGVAQRAFGELFEQRRVEPQDDLLSGLIGAVDGDDRLSQPEIIVTLIFLYAAGYETVMDLIGSMVHTLMKNPDQLARLRADRSLVQSTVDETVRYEAPIQLAPRLARTDVEIGGQMIPAGHVAVMMIGAANRDPAAIEDPDRYIVGRDSGPMLAFSSGVHYCMGAALGRLEGRVVLAALLDRFETWTALDDNPPWKANPSFRGLRRLPVAFS